MQAAALSLPHGASPDEWMHFALTFGAADLLPVVSNPRAAISELSTIRQLGKTPSKYNRHRSVVGFPGWPTYQATDKDIAAWSREPDYGICIQTRHVRALDVDVEDPTQSRRIAAHFLSRLGLGVGDVNIRTRPNSGKLLIPLWVPSAEDMPKRSFKVRADDGSCAGVVELLANRQHFVAIGTHPSGVKYEWSRGLPIDFPHAQP